MDLQALDTKIDSLLKEVYELKGRVSTLTELLGVYQKSVSTLDGRLWGALIMSAGGLAGGILTLVLGFVSKH